MRDLRKTLRPIRSQVRFWGHQSNIKAVYQNLDFVLSGLPEREALGLNLIEAQQLGTPVIAVDAPPFIETVLHGVTGWLYEDPRKDNGASFKKLMLGIISGKLQLKSTGKNKHLEEFSMNAFSIRLNNAIKDYL